MEELQYCSLNKKGSKLLKEKQNVELPEEYREVGLPAHKAVFGEDVEGLQLIFCALADRGVPLRDTYESTPLHLAARKNDAKIAKWLLDNTDIDPIAKAQKGETAFHVAAAQGSLKVLEVMVLHDSDLKETIATCLDNSCFTPLHLAIIRHHNQVVRFLISKLGNKAIGPINESGVNAAHVAASVGNVDALKMIYSKNRKMLHLVAKDLTTPLFFAAQEGHFTALQYLHQKGKCDLASRSFDGMSPIHAACQSGHLEIMQYITSKLGKSATFDQTPEGSTPLHFAASAGHEEIVRWLVNNDLTGTIAFIQDNNGDIPAHDAADNGHTEILKILLENGADIHAANKDGFTPYALASQGPFKDTAAFAIKYATANSPTKIEEKSSKMKIFDLENIQKEDGKDDSEISPYDSMAPTMKSENDENEATEASNDKLLEWNKEDMGLFEESKIKPSHLTSLATQEYEKRTSKRQARKMAKSIKEHITQTATTQETPFKPHMNVNPLAEESSKTDAEEEPKVDVDALYSKPDPEVVRSKTKKMEAKTENVTAVVNEYFDEEEPEGNDKLPSLPPVEPVTGDDTKEDIKDNTPDENTADMEPLIKIEDESAATQKEKPASVDEDKAVDKDEAVDVQPSPTIENVPAHEDTIVKEDVTAETHTNMVDEEQTLVTEQENVTTVTHDEEAEGEAKGINENADNIPLIDVKKPSSAGKFGLKQAKRKEYSGFTAPNQDAQSGAGDELKKVFAKYRKK